MDYLSDIKKAVNRESRHWHCPRAGRTVNENMCKMCVSDVITRTNFMHYADDQGVDWMNEPCPYECGFDLDAENHLSVEDSIRNNFWMPDGFNDSF